MSDRVQRAPAVSVLVTTFNHGGWVAEALDSLAAQTFTDFEVLVVDDHSTDDTVEVVRTWLRHHDLSARLIAMESNVGVAAVMNHALRAAGGAYVSGMSGDDRGDPRWLEVQHAVLSTSDERVCALFTAICA